MNAIMSPAVERIPADFMRDAYEFFAKYRAQEPREVVMPHGSKVWMVTRYDDVRTLLTDPRVSKDGLRMNELFVRHSACPVAHGDAATAADSQAESCPAGDSPAGDSPAAQDAGTGDHGFDDELSAHILNSDVPRHTRLRTLVSKAFTSRRMEGLRPRIAEVADELLDAMDGQSEVDLISTFAMPLPITIIFDLLGIPQQDQDAVRGWQPKLVGASVPPEEIAEASRQVTSYASELIDAKRAHPGDDLVSALVQVSEDSDRLTHAELVAMIFLLVVAAGSETPMNQLGVAMHTLLTHPDELARLQRDPSLWPAAVEELLRFEGTVAVATFRFTTADIPVGGVTIPAGEILALALGSANRDPGHFADPDRFDVTRHPRGSLGLGHGVHYCLGAPLAKLELEIALSRLFARYPGMRLAVDSSELTWAESNLMRGVTELPAVLGSPVRA